MIITSTAFQYSVVSSDLVKAGVEFRYSPPKGQGYDSKELSEVMRYSDVGIVGDDACDFAFFSACQSLSLLVRWGSGTDNVDYEAAAQFGVKVVNTPGLFGEDVADLAIGLAINAVRGLNFFDRSILQGSWIRTTKYSLRSIKYLILGCGVVGREIAQHLSTWGTEVTIFDPILTPGQVVHGAEVVGNLDDALSQANLVFVALPLTKNTAGLLGRSRIERLREPRFLVNVSRGEVLKQDEVFEALDNGLLEGIGMDVFEREPIQVDRLPSRVSNAVFTSHNASNTFMSISRANARVDEILNDFFLQRGLT